jgi:hypothetical protein
MKKETFKYTNFNFRVLKIKKILKMVKNRKNKSKYKKIWKRLNIIKSQIVEKN